MVIKPVSLILDPNETIVSTLSCGPVHPWIKLSLMGGGRSAILLLFKINLGNTNMMSQELQTKDNGQEEFRFLHYHLEEILQEQDIHFDFDIRDVSHLEIILLQQ